jgi:hypothetical protein
MFHLMTGTAIGANLHDSLQHLARQATKAAGGEDQGPPSGEVRDLGGPMLAHHVGGSSGASYAEFTLIPAEKLSISPREVSDSVTP